MPAKTTTELITSLVGEYYRHGDRMTAEQLIDLRRRLSGLKYVLALETGSTYKEKNATEFTRKRQFAKIRQDKIDAGESGVKAEAAAEAEIAKEREQEQLADAIYRASYLILESSKDVLDAIAQQIANLRQEKREEMAGRGSQ